MSTEKEILQLEDSRYAAMLANDQKTLEALFHEDLIYTHSTGVVDTKASYLQALQSGKTQYKSTRRMDERVRVLGDAALVTGTARFEVTVNGTAKSLHLCFLNAWTKTPAGWQFIGWQSCSLPG